MSEEIEVTINVTAEEAVKILNAKEQEITYLKNEIARLSQQTQHSEPQLTIPKSAADILDKVFNDFEELQNSANSLMIRAIYEHYYPEDPFYKWCYKEKDSYNISIIYLAGKALGVDLVKVGADD